MLSTDIYTTPERLMLVPHGDPALLACIGDEAILPGDHFPLFAVWLSKDRARSLIADLGNLPQPPRIAGVVEEAGCWLYIWPQDAKDYGLKLLLSDYSDVRQLESGRLPDHPCWACGRALWLLLGGR